MMIVSEIQNYITNNLKHQQIINSFQVFLPNFSGFFKAQTYANNASSKALGKGAPGARE